MIVSLLWYLSLALVVSGYFFWFRAMARLSSEGASRRNEMLFFSKLFAGRELFTPDGWRMRNRAVLCVVGATLAAGLALLVGGLPFPSVSVS